MNKCKRYPIVLLILFISFILVACNEEAVNKEEKGNNQASEKSQVNKTGMPIVDDPITIEFMTGKPPLTHDDYNEVTIWKEYEEMTNIHIDWGLIPNEGLIEKRNLALAGENYPEAFYSAGLPDIDLYKYGEQGIILELDELINDYMPNLRKIFDDNPDIEKGMRFPDGKIYSLPTIFSPDFTSVLSGNKPYIREDWLKQLDMSVPETTDQFYEFLKAVKETDLNGNGKHDEIPFGSHTVGTIIFYLKGSFGVGNKGINHPYLDTDPDSNELRFYPMSEGYKDLLQYINKLYSEELIEQNIFSIEQAQFQATGTEGLYASTVTSSPETRWGMRGEYIGMPALEGPNGNKEWSYVTTPLANKGGFTITDKNKNPEATARWMDYFYGDEGSKLFFLGIEGVTFEEVDGELQYVEEIRDNAEGLSLQEAQRPHITYIGGGYPGLVKEEFFKGAESLASSIEAAKAFENDTIEEVWPPFTFTKEEMDILIPLENDIHKYVDEMTDKFIVGEADFSDWDDYIKQIEKMNLDKYMEIQEEAYKRYQSH